MPVSFAPRAQFALLLLDVQRDFWSEGTAEHFPDFPANLTRLLATCRAEHTEVIHLRAESDKSAKCDCPVRTP